MSSDSNIFVGQTNKTYGEATVVKGSDIVIPHRFTSGSLSLDVALGGGWPAWWSEIRGRESMGKTAVAFKTVAANQRVDPDFSALWVAAEGYDKEQAEKCGVDNSRMHVIPTQEMEKAFEILVDAAGSKQIDMAILDSYAALIPSEESEKAMDQFTTAVGARLMNKFVRKAGEATRRDPYGTERPFCGLIINQMRDKIGGFSPYGVPQTTPGGHGKDYFYYSILDVARDDWITEKRPGFEAVKVGQTIKFKTTKNKSFSPQQTAAVDFYFRDAPTLNFRRGDYDKAKEYFLMGVLFGVIKKGGAWYTYGTDRWMGKEKAMTAIRADMDLQQHLADDVLTVSANPAAMDLLLTKEGDTED
jgi:recombination protein RecA